MSWDEGFLGARASRPHKDGFLGARASRPHQAWHSLGHLPHLDQPGTAPWLSFGLADAVPAHRVAACSIALKLSGNQRDSMRAGRPRSQGNHSPLEGESQKPSRQVKADAVGGWRATSQKADVLPLETPGCPGAGKRLMTWLHFLNDCAEINKMLNASIQSLSTIHRKVVSRLQASTAMPQH